MKLGEKMTEGGITLSQQLDVLFLGLKETDPDAPDLFLHLRDVHDGAVHLERCITELANTPKDDLPTINRLLWEIRAELFDHLLPNHLEELRPVLNRLCSKLAEGVHGQDDDD